MQPNGKPPEAMLAQLNDEELATFEAFYAQALAARQVEEASDDPYQAEFDLIAELRARSRGEVDGIAWVPLAGDGLARISREQLGQQAAGPIAVPRSDDAAPERSFQWRYLAGALLIALLLILMLPRSSTSGVPTGTQEVPVGSLADPTLRAEPQHDSEHSAPPQEAHAAGLAADLPAPEAAPEASSDVHILGAELAQPASLHIPGRARITAQIVPSPAELGTPWQPIIEPGTAAWLQASTINIVLALPGDVEPRLRRLRQEDTIELRLIGGALRRYEVASVKRYARYQTEVLAENRVSLTLLAAGTPGEQRTVVQARLIDD